MNKSQLIVMWIGAAVFVLCAWNPSIVPHVRYRWEYVEYTDEEWERELSQYDLSLADSKESLRDKISPKGLPLGFEIIFSNEQEGKYIKMLLKGERPTKRVEADKYYIHRQFFKNGSTSLLARLLSVTVITALVVYTLGDKNRVKVKEILQPLLRFEPKMENKPKDEQKE